MTKLLLAVSAAGAALVAIRFGRIIELLLDSSQANTVAGLFALTLPIASLLAWRWIARPDITAHRNEGPWRRLLTNPQFTRGSAVIIAIGSAAILAPALTPFDPIAQPDVLGSAALAPSLTHPFGTDFYSRDVFSRMLYGARWSLGVALISVSLLVIIGTCVGLAAGMAGGMVDQILMRVVDAGLAVPRILLLLVLTALWNNLTFWALATILGLTGWFGISRLVRAQVLTLKQRDFIAVTRGLGVSHWRLLTRHMMPNLAAPIIVTAALGVGNIVLIEASLSYLGIGARAPQPAWGNIIRDAGDVLYSAPWVSVFPGVAIFATVIGFSLIGDGLSGALNPKNTWHRY